MYTCEYEVGTCVHDFLFSVIYMSAVNSKRECTEGRSIKMAGRTGLS
jgi:hypothetical protein